MNKDFAEMQVELTAAKNEIAAAHAELDRAGVTPGHLATRLRHLVLDNTILQDRVRRLTASVARARDQRDQIYSERDAAKSAQAKAEAKIVRFRLAWRDLVGDDQDLAGGGHG